MSTPATTASYLRGLDRSLVGPRRVRAGLVREAAGHLEDATAAYRAAGYADREAAALAIRDFGPVEEVAPAFQTTLAVAASRRTAWLLLAALAIQPFLWDGGLNLAAGAADAAEAAPGYAILDAFIEVSGLVVMVGAVLALVGTGVGQRWFGAGRRTARLTAWFTLAACAFVPAQAVAMTVLVGSASRPAVWAFLAAGLLLPLAGSARSAQLCLRAA